MYIFGVRSTCGRLSRSTYDHPGMVGRPGTCFAPLGLASPLPAGLNVRAWALLPGRAQIFEQALAAPFAPEAALPVAAKTGGGVEQVGAVDPHRAGFELAGDIQRQVDIVAPDAGSQPVARVVRQVDRLRRACGRSARPAPGRRFPPARSRPQGPGSVISVGL